MGLGSCYIGDILERYETHRALFALPPYAVPAAMLCIGYPTVQQRARQKPPRFAMEDIVFENAYQPRDLAIMLARRRASMEKHSPAILPPFASANGTAPLAKKCPAPVRK